MGWLKSALRVLLRLLYRVEITGLEHLEEAGKRVLIVANHTSFLDAVLLVAYLPGEITFAVNTFVAKNRLFRPLLALTRIFPMDPTNPLAAKALIKYLKEDRRAVIFPEGRITVTGSLMKIYDGTGMVADYSGAAVVPVRIDGALYTPFSRMKGRVRLRWFPKIRIRILPSRSVAAPAEIRGRERRKMAGKQLYDLMTEMMFETGDYQRTLFSALLDARRIHGGNHPIVEDVQRTPLTYNHVIAGAFALGRKLAARSQPQERVGILLPTMSSTVVTFMALQAYGRVPAMLNYTIGLSGMLSACHTAQLRTVLTSRRFVAGAKLENVIEGLAKEIRVVYLEDLAPGIGGKLLGLTLGFFSSVVYRFTSNRADAQTPAVVLFTSGSEGTPKGVVLSHANLLANRAQLAARVDFSAQDVILNALPLFHSFGLTAGTLLPLLSGMRTFFYPSPLHYRIIPEIAYDVNATILFGTNTFLAGYARFAHVYDFYSVRYVFAGAEKLQEQTRRTFEEKFGVRIFEGYGATETSPVLAANTPMDNNPGTVGRLLPGIRFRIDPVPGVHDGGRLSVSGPNVMLGYLLSADPGVLVPPVTDAGPGWYDTGDIVSVDRQGFIRIQGRAKRFAKVGGEMVSLAAAEDLAARTWPTRMHAVIAVPDPQKGEQLVLVTDQPDADRATLLAQARLHGIGEINVPKRMLVTKKLPLMGTGKVDYPGVQELVRNSLEIAA